MQAVNNKRYQQGVKEYSRSSEEALAQKEQSPINEIVIGGSSLSQAALFLKPILSELADETRHRWLTLVVPCEYAPRTIKWLKSSGINNNRVQVLHQSTNLDSLELTRKALASGTSHTVVSWVNQLDKPSLEELESAARDGQCQGLAIRHKIHA